MKVPYFIHVLNFLIKLMLFSLLFGYFQFMQLIKLNPIYLVLLPLFFTVIGVVADWTIVPKFHNIVSSLMGSIFMGTVTYLLAVYFNIGIIPLNSAILLGIGLGAIEATLHHLIIKPFLNNA